MPAAHHEHDDVIDPDVDLHDAEQRAETATHEGALLATIALGGLVGAEARYGLDRAFPYAAGDFAGTTLLINGLGSLLIGVLMVWVLEVARPHRLARPFLGVGVLGGFTTFSTFALDVVQQSRHHHLGSAIGYVAASVIVCCAATAAAVGGTRALAERRAA